MHLESVPLRLVQVRRQNTTILMVPDVLEEAGATYPGSGCFR